MQKYSLVKLFYIFILYYFENDYNLEDSIKSFLTRIFQIYIKWRRTRLVILVMISYKQASLSSAMAFSTEVSKSVFKLKNLPLSYVFVSFLQEI